MISLDEDFFGWVNAGDANETVCVRHLNTCGALLLRTTNTNNDNFRCLYGFHFTFGTLDAEIDMALLYLATAIRLAVEQIDLLYLLLPGERWEDNRGPMGPQYVQYATRDNFVTRIRDAFGYHENVSFINWDAVRAQLGEDPNPDWGLDVRYQPNQIAFRHTPVNDPTEARPNLNDTICRLRHHPVVAVVQAHAPFQPRYSTSDAPYTAMGEGVGQIPLDLIQVIPEPALED